VTELTAKLGQPQSVEMKGSDAEHYGDHALLTTRAPIDWQWPKKLHFRAYGHDMAVRLSLAPGPNAPPPSDGMEADGWHRVSDRKKRRRAAAKAQLCRDFRRGACDRGESCIFRHGASNICVVSGCQGGCGNLHITKATPEACRDFARGRCERGQCRFVHASPATAETQAESARTQAARVPPAAGQGSPAATGLARSGPGRPAASSIRSSSSSSSSSVGSLTAQGRNRPGPVHISLEPHASPASPSASTSSTPPRRPRRGPLGDEQDEQDSTGDEQDKQDPTSGCELDDASMSLQGTSRTLPRSRRRSPSPPLQPGSPREDWNKSLSVSPPGQPRKKKLNTRSSKTSSPASTLPAPSSEATASRAEEHGPQQLQAAPLEGAGPAAL
jgi:hypothetical protein